MPRRFQAPTVDGEVLAEPGFDAVPALIDANRRLLDRDDVRIGGMILRELRALARREVLEAAQRPPVAMGGLSVDAPLLLGGHQPELSHPGVWVKNFALNGLARKLGGLPLHLEVDNDTLKSTSLRFPVFNEREPESVHLESVKFDRLITPTPFEDRAVIDAELFRTFPDRAAKLWKNWSYEPLLASVWRDGGRLGEVFSEVRRRCEREWGCWNSEVSVSRLSQTDAFRRFAGHILNDLPRFRAVYNAALQAYRKANGIRSANHPAPDLGPDEAPFWEAAAGCRRRPATASRQLTLPGLRPRALTLTLFSRVCLGDFFLHGIGGGKYDEVTDAIIRDYFDLEPPAYQVLSATLHLPLPGFDSTNEDVKRAKNLVRDLHWNPQRHVVSPALDDPQMLRLVADRIALASNEPPYSDRATRRDWFRRLQEMNEQLRSHVWEQVAPAKASLRRADAEQRANSILKRRDYSWVLYPEGKLRPFLQQFLEM